MKANPLTRLRIFIANSYELDEFRLLCTDLSILYADLGGGDRISTKADRLLYLIGQQRRYDELLMALRQTRPQAFEQGGFVELTAEALQDALPVFAGDQVAVSSRPKSKKRTDKANMVGRYQVQEELGRGSFAVVYKAVDSSLNRPVALKVLHDYWQDREEFVERFRLEAQTAANLRHHNIVRVIEFDQGEDGKLFLAMEFLPGQTLEKFLVGRGPLALGEALPILKQIASALDYAHSQDIVHRDLKPGNVMVEATPNGPLATLTDFGLVKAMEGSVAMTMHATALVGSPEYMAPEQVDADNYGAVGPAADRYALGILAYRLLTGRVPFRGKLAAILYGHEMKPPPAPQEVASDISETAETALLKMLAKRPDERFGTCLAFVGALSDPPSPSRAERLAALYSQLLAAVDSENWIEVLMLGGQIRGLSANYRDVAEYVRQAQEALVQPRYQEQVRISKSETDEWRGGKSGSLPVKDDNGDVWVNPITGKEMVRVAGGTFLFGEEKEERQLPEFWIDKTPVTNAEYARFVVEKGFQPPSHWERKKEPPVELADHPVAYVSLKDARAYAEWAGGNLPSEEQWEKAARGADGRQYPWGNQWEGGRCNTKEANVGATTPVGRFSPAGDSPYGCIDMSGNVWEWIGQEYVVKGGSFGSSKDSARAAARRGYTLGYRLHRYGFRLVVAAPFSTSDL